MSRKYTITIWQDDTWYVAQCMELGVTSQGKTIDDAQKNIKEAIELYIESFGEDDLPPGSQQAMLMSLEVA